MSETKLTPAEERAERQLQDAAPTMLAALQRMLVCLERDGYASAIAVLNTDGRAAIAKATAPPAQASAMERP